MEYGFQILSVDKLGSAALFVSPEGDLQSRLPLLQAPHEILISLDGRSAYVSIYGSGIYKKNPVPGSHIQVLDLASRTVVRTISIAPYTSPHGLTFDAQGTLWTSCDKHETVLALSAETGLIEAVVPTGTDGTHWVLASPNGTRLFTSNKETRFLSVIDPFTRKVTNRIPTPHGSEGMCFSANGRFLYVADHTEAQLLLVDCEREIVDRVLPLRDLKMDLGRSSHHMRIKASVDGRILAVSSYHYDAVILIDLDDPSQQTLLRTGRGPMAMLFHPYDHDTLYVSNHEEGSLSLVSVIQKRVLRTVPCGEGIESMEIIGAEIQ